METVKQTPKIGFLWIRIKKSSVIMKIYSYFPLLFASGRYRTNCSSAYVLFETVVFYFIFSKYMSYNLLLQEMSELTERHGI